MTNVLIKEIKQVCTQLYYFGKQATSENLRDYNNRVIKTWIFIVTSLLLTCGLALLLLSAYSSASSSSP